MTRYATQVAETGRKPYLYAACSCGYTGSTFCQREWAELERREHEERHAKRGE